MIERLQVPARYAHVASAGKDRKLSRQAGLTMVAQCNLQRRTSCSHPVAVRAFARPLGRRTRVPRHGCSDKGCSVGDVVHVATAVRAGVQYQLQDRRAAVSLLRPLSHSLHQHLNLRRRCLAHINVCTLFKLRAYFISSIGGVDLQLLTVSATTPCITRTSTGR